MKRSQKRLRYYVLTWDETAQTFTPQESVRIGPYSLFGLRKAIRALRELGYGARKDDPCVYVERTGR